MTCIFRFLTACHACVQIKGPPRKLSNKEKKARDKLRKARRDRGEEVSESEEDL